jgi:hypothetical protein
MSELYKALVKFQSEMKPVPKEASNPHYKSNFADLSGIIQAASPLLAKNGLGFLQTMRVDGERNILQTKIIHASGQSELSEIIVPHQNDPQKLGALITYLKRYSLQAALGIPTEDDDAESVSAPMRESSGGSERQKKSDIPNREYPPSQKQIGMIERLAWEKGVDLKSHPFPETSRAAGAWIDRLMKMEDKGTA